MPDVVRRAVPSISTGMKTQWHIGKPGDCFTVNGNVYRHEKNGVIVKVEKENARLLDEKYQSGGRVFENGFSVSFDPPFIGTFHKGDT